MNDPNTDPAERPATDIPDTAATPDATDIPGVPAPARRPENRLNVPKSLCKAAGFLPGDTAYVADHDPAGAVQKPVLVLLKAKPENPRGEFAVSKDGRIRVTPTIQKACGLGGDKCEFEGSEGKIVVRPVAV